ncbi:MAG: GH1 family beta-glucosidase [Chloroflexota bacterium]
MTRDSIHRFPEGFMWGTATSAYQIEGGVNEDGRGPSIWDTFSHLPGKTYQGHSGDVAADHYHRWRQDVAIMSELGLKAYRFSVAWPRVFPHGAGRLNPAGLAFYERLVEALLQRGIEPVLTLFHWDLPQALQDQGGWPNRGTALHFADYAAAVADRLRDRVRFWITHNEPFVAAAAGHLTGEHAPGQQDPAAALRAGHHLLLSHGLAVEALRARLPSTARVGITLNLSPVHPASDSEQDQRAAIRFDGALNRMALDPVLLGQYPDDIVAAFGPLFPTPEPGDLEKVAAPLDFLGVNYYSRTVVRHDPQALLLEATQIQPEGNAYSQMWEIYPLGMYEILTRVWADYGKARPAMRLLVTENGVPLADGPDLDGRIRDPRRIRYLRDHILQVHRALEEGVPLDGYFVWSLLDNFEWAHGYRMRFGLVYVDFDTRARTVKESGRWFARLIRANAVDPDE